jgi:hypothetical protein
MKQKLGGIKRMNSKYYEVSDPIKVRTATLLLMKNREFCRWGLNGK